MSILPIPASSPTAGQVTVALIQVEISQASPAVQQRVKGYVDQIDKWLKEDQQAAILAIAITGAVLQGVSSPNKDN